MAPSNFDLFMFSRDPVYNEHTSSTKGVTAAVLSFLCVACVFNVVGIFLSMENAFIVPIQTLQGPIGLYIWYSISGKYTSKQFKSFQREFL